MHKTAAVISILLLSTFSSTAIGNKPNIKGSKILSTTSNKQPRLLIAIPIDASTDEKEKSEWFGGLLEQYLHFRIGASSSLDIIPSDEIHQAITHLKKTSMQDKIPYIEFAKEFGATHILDQNYEIGHDDKTVHFYAEIRSPSMNTISYEKTFALEDFTTEIDSCIFWFFKSTKINLNMKLLSRFFNLSTISSDIKEMKTIGKIISRIYSSTMQDINNSTNALLEKVEQDPRNLLAQYVAAKLFEHSNQYDKAISQIKALLTIVPNYASLYGNLCRDYRLCKKYKESLAHAVDAEKKGIITQDLLLEGALSLEAMGKYSNAIKAFKAILEKDPIEQNALLFFARQSNRENNAKAAIDYTDRIIAVNNNNGMAYLEKGKALMHLKQYKEAEKTLTKSAGLLIDASIPTGLIGDIYVLNKDFAKAARYYEAVLKSKTKEFDLHLKIVETWEKASNFERALKALKRAESIFTDSLILQKKLGLITCKTGDTTAAILHLENFIDKKMDDAQVLMTIGKIYTNKRKYEKAFYIYNHAIPLLSDKTEGLFSLALLYLKKGDTGAAISHLKEILKKHQDYPDAHRFLADAFYKEKDFNTALKEYKKARYFKKDDLYIQKRIALIYFKLKEYNATEREYQNLLSKNKEDAESYFYLAISQLNLKKVSMAEKNLKTAYKLGSADADIMYELGLGYISLSQPKKATKFLKQCIEKEPKHENALLELSKIYNKEKNMHAEAEINMKLFNIDNNKYIKCLANAGLLYEKANDIETAYKIYIRFIKHNYINPDINIHLARIESKYKKYGKVISLLENIPKSNISEKEDMMILADAYYSTGKHKEAIQWLLKVISKNSGNKEALIMLAISYEKTDDISNARKTYERIIELTTGKEQANYAYKTATLYENSGNLTDAITQYSHNISTYPQDLRNYNRLLNIYIKLKNWKSARELLEKSTKLDNAKPHYLKKLAEICLKDNDKKSAVENYQKYLKINPNDHDAWYELGNLYFGRKLYSKAIVLYKKANKLNPNNFKILYQSALTFYFMQEVALAASLFNKAYAIENKNIDVLNYLSLCYRSLGETDNLLATLKKIIALQPDNYTAKIELGCTYLAQNNIEEALKNLEEACKMNPNDAESHIILARIYEKTGNDNARYSHLKKALDINPKNADVHSLIGKFYKDKNQIKKALYHIKEAIEINPEHTEALCEYSMHLFTTGETNDALTPIKRAIKNDPSNPKFLLLYAQITYTLNEKDQALKIIADAIKLDSNDVDILSYAGFLYKDTGKTEKAKNILSKAIALSDKCWECYSYLGDIYFEETDCAKASGYFHRALDIKGYDEDIMMKLGRSQILSYQNSSAKETLEKILLKNPKHHEAFYRLAHIYLLENDFEKANMLISQRKSDKKTVWDHLVVGEMCEIQGDINAALISYTVALRLYPDMVEAHAGKGRIDLIRKNYNDAIVNFSKALVKDPYNPYLLLDLGRAYEGIGQFSSAYDIYVDISNKYSQIPDTYCLLAGIKNRHKDYLQAVEIVKKGLKYNPENAKLYSTLGHEYKILGEFKNAIEAYKNAAKYGEKKYINSYLEIANIFKNNLSNEKEAKKFIKKYLKKGGNKKEIEEYNLANLDI